MNKEEARNLLNNNRPKGNNTYSIMLNEALNMAIKALEQEPCEDEYIKVPKKALKYRTKGMVAYNAEWLKNHFDIERAVICGAQQPCEDTISRQVVLDIVDGYGESQSNVEDVTQDIISDIVALPPVNPQEPKMGHWIEILRGFECDQCHGIDTDALEPPYCKWCGIQMKRANE